MLADRPFRRYWSASTISMFGDGISSLAVPLTAATVLHANSAQMGLLGALTWTPSLLFSLHAGVWADRVGHRRVTMIFCNVASFLLLASIPVSYLTGTLTIWQLYAVVFAAGAAFVLFDVCDISLFASLLKAERYIEGQSLMFSSQSMSTLAGPSLGGLLVQALSAPFAIAADAVSFLWSAIFLSSIHPEEPPPASREGRSESLTAGLRYIRHTSVIRTALSVATTVNLFNLMFRSVLVLYLSRDLHVSPGIIGLVLAAEAGGGLVASMFTKRLTRVLGVGRAMMVGCVVVSLPLLFVPLAGGPELLLRGMLIIGLFGSGFGRVVQNVGIGTVFAVAVPPDMRSRVRGAFQAISFGARPIGSLIGGGLAALAGLKLTLLTGAIGGTLAFAWIVPSALLTFRMPEAGTPAD
ncbi:MFS transporter [Streptomyces misionensis]|uniref:MFS transporter n=1 Tax=Streptomyces misionensis TaxID=67331 RepID=UPI003683EEFD